MEDTNYTTVTNSSKTELLAEEKRKNKQMLDEFNAQRAKLRELYLQKEEEVNSIKKELDEVKSQLLITKCKTENEIEFRDKKAQEEITSLQQLVQETIEESSIIKQELERLQTESGRLQIENRELREELIAQQQQENSSLAPVLSHVKKTLARKLGADSGSTSGSHDSLDDSMRKAQEDAEVLRSLVVPLEEEIKALKEKLRSTDEELQFYRNASQKNPSSPILNILTSDVAQFSKPDCYTPLPTSTVTLTQQNNLASSDVVCKSTSMDHIQCEQCQNYETKIQQLQKDTNEKSSAIDKLQKSLDDAKEELNKEAALRQDLEQQWQEKREAHKEEVQLLTDQVKHNEKELITVQQQFLELKEEINKQLYRLTEDRERVNKQLQTLQSDNDFLSGKYLETAEEIENQYINLPNNVEELQELLLKQQNDLIQARLGCEFEKRKSVSYKDEAEILREQLNSINVQKAEYERKVQSRMKNLEYQLRSSLVEQENHRTIKEKYERQEVELNNTISELRVKVIELQDANEKLEKANIDVKSKMKILQEDLATSEQVQKDFVKLSQSLQIALEKFRQADTQVRWQDDDDVDQCSNCHIMFTVTCRKQHCRHCGTIYCDKCLTKTVPSGPSKKLARVCDICHTLLIPNTAPYFSQEPPHSPN